MKKIIFGFVSDATEELLLLFPVDEVQPVDSPKGSSAMLNAARNLIVFLNFAGLI
jgi:hypothetical protein